MENKLTEQRDYLQSIVDTVRDPILVLDKRLHVVSANRAFYRTFRVDQDATEGTLVYELGNSQWDIPALRVLLEDILPQDSSFNDFEVTHKFPGIGRKAMLLNARKLYRPGNHTEMLLLAIEDVTARRAAETAAQEALDKLQAAYEREHHIATVLQRPLSLQIAEDAFEGVSIATLYEATFAEAEIGGDFFDVFSLPRDQLLCAVGDASGKGLPAAARAMQVKDVLRAFAREYPHSIAHIAARLNDYVCDVQTSDEADMTTSFICLVMVVLNPHTGEANAISAGAEPPFILRKNGETETLAVIGSPLGVTPQTLYSTSSFHLQSGDTLLLLTDGVTEARNAQKQFLDHGGMLELAKRGQGVASLNAMGKIILEGAKAFSGGHLRDDACLLLLRKK